MEGNTKCLPSLLRCLCVPDDGRQARIQTQHPPAAPGPRDRQHRWKLSPRSALMHWAGHRKTRRGALGLSAIGRGWCMRTSRGSQPEINTNSSSQCKTSLKYPSEQLQATKRLIAHLLQDSNEQLSFNRNNILPCSRQGQIHCATQGDKDRLALGALLAPWAARYIFCRQKML